jgi:site-specific recombinase XerD
MVLISTPERRRWVAVVWRLCLWVHRRHTHATDLLRAGWDAAYVQRRLGHAHIQTTVSTYAHLSTENMGEMFERYQKERAR